MAAEARSEPSGLAPLILALYVIFAATTTGIAFAEGGPPSGEYQVRWLFGLSDVALAAMVLTQLPALRTLWTERSRHRCALAAIVLALSLLPALAANPSVRGAFAEFRLVGVAMVVFAAGRLVGTGRNLVLGALAGATSLQVLVALAERAGDGPVGLASMGESRDVFEIGGRYASTGLTIHPYVFAAWCVLASAVLLAAIGRARRPGKGLVAAAILPFVGIGLTMSRTGAVAVVLVLAALAAASLRQPRLRVIFAAAVVASALGAALNLSGWTNRAVGTVRAGSAASVTSNRTQLLEQAGRLWEESPVLGVGPGRYVEALVERPEIEKLATEHPPRPVHLVPFLLLVEGGLVVLPALVFLVWAVLAQTRRAGVLGFGITLAVLPFLLLDHLHWSYPQGLLLTAVWLGALDYFAATPDGAG